MNIDHNADVLDVRDIIARIEELETDLCDEFGIENDEDENTELRALIAENDADDPSELRTLYALLDELAGNGGDEQWRGTWYPVTLIAESYFTDYARELAEDSGMIDRESSWPNNCIDWDAAAEQLQQDYTSCEIIGNTFYYR
mgnify:CR=1 FL=1